MPIKSYLIDDKLFEIVIYKDYYNGQISTVFLNFDSKNYKLIYQSMESFDNFNKYIYRSDVHCDITKENSLLLVNGLRTPVIVDKMTKSSEFDKLYYYDNNDLGANYTKDKTVFKIWAPTATYVKVEIINHDETITVSLHRGDKGVWSVEVLGDLDLASYVYILKVNGVLRESIDPYAYSSTPNNKRSVVIDLDKVTKVEFKDIPPKYPYTTDTIIYETHIRDFSSDSYSNITSAHTFLGVVEEGVRTENDELSSLDYLIDLGITHIQFLPVYDFGSVDEENIFDFYNWGYDPVQYNVPEGSYASKVSDPYSRINDLIEMNNRLHKHGLRSIMDVVYNHVFDVNTNALQNIVPGYYFRYDSHFYLSNGSFCGNDIESNSLMCRKFIVDSCLRWINMYGFDGFRFDLMGILDIKTMNTIREELDKIDETILLFGEGWHMPTTLDDNLQASMRNQDSIPRIGHFNDRIRNNVKNFASGNHFPVNVTNQCSIDDVIINCVMGSSIGTNNVAPYFISVKNTINYIECHDNETFYDYLKYIKKIDPKYILERHRFATTIILLSQGVPFLHSGQEMYRTKQGIENSYQSPDSINSFDWKRKDKHIQYVKYIKKILKFRKNNKVFRLNNEVDIKNNISYAILSTSVIKFELLQENIKYTFILNGSNSSFNFELPSNSVLVLDSYRCEFNHEGIEYLGYVTQHTAMLYMQQI